jgi:two-component system chemotaxis sensor kinase CheA
MTAGGRSFFDQFLDDFYMESGEHLRWARNKMLSIESAGANRPLDAAVLDDLLRCFHSLKGLSAMVGLEEATQVAHHVEDYLRELKRPNTVLSAQGIEHVVEGIAAIEQVIEAKRVSKAAPDTSLVLIHLDADTDEIRGMPSASTRSKPVMWRFVFRSSPELAEKGFTVTTVLGQLRKVGEVVQASPRILEQGQVAFEFIVASAESETAFAYLQGQGVEYARVTEGGIVDSAPSQESSSEPRAAAVSAIRVDMDRLDELMRLVGELVISRFRLDEVLRTSTITPGAWNAVQEVNHSMERQLRDLRDGVMRIRMVQIGQVFERMRFVARGLERELKKRVEVRIDGQDTEIDKLIVERMMDPLLHLVRNAISHGLESPAERAAAGKPETGVVRLSARTAGDTVVIEVEDDGRGIDANKIAERARALKQLGEHEVLDSRRLLDIISASGFTTRDEADLASGRGVGMAAVQGAINDLGGSIVLATNPGTGTCFTIRLPLTLLIADSLMVTVNQQRFAVPQTAVQEVLAVESSSIKVFENNEVVPFRGSVLPVLRLARLFGLGEREQKRLHLLVVENGGSPTALAVDRINGLREIVVRTITDPLVRVPGVVGATELGDGRPVLILDPHSLIRTARTLLAPEVPS